MRLKTETSRSQSQRATLKDLINHKTDRVFAAKPSARKRPARAQPTTTSASIEKMKGRMQGLHPLGKSKEGEAEIHEIEPPSRLLEPFYNRSAS